MEREVHNSELPNVAIEKSLARLPFILLEEDFQEHIRVYEEHHLNSEA